MKSYQLLLESLKNIEYGTLKIQIINNNQHFEYRGAKNGPSAEIIVNDPSIFDRLMIGGDVVFGESYIDGQWSCDNLENLLVFITLNSPSLEVFFHAKKFKLFFLYLKSLLNKNNLIGSKKNISFHYDLGNEFYQLWLDPSMTYSSALFKNQDFELEEAQNLKYQNILNKLSGNTILEIGCGWGGFMEQAIKANYQITGLTLSKAQKQYADQRLMNYQKNIEIKLQDYRNEFSIYDNIVSIEMFEAVGKEYWQNYFQVLNRCLKTNGKAILQIITIDEKIFKDYLKRVDFIQKHIFPGGILPSKSKIYQLSSENNFIIKSELDFAEDYAKTLRIWLKNFNNKLDQIKALGFDDRFIRKWQFYLGYCIAGFETKRTSVVQFELIKKT